MTTLQCLEKKEKEPCFNKHETPPTPLPPPPPKKSNFDKKKFYQICCYYEKQCISM